MKETVSTILSKTLNIAYILFMSFCLLVFMTGVVSGVGSLSGYPIAFGVGDSMEPTIPAGCSVVISDSEGYTVSEGDIITYDDNWVGNGDIGVTHRVIEKYESYDPDSAEYYINEKDRFVHEESSRRISSWSTPMTYEEGQSLEGETVYILHGDNNVAPDPQLVTEEDVRSKLITTEQIPSQVCSYLITIEEIQSYLHNLVF